MTIPSKHSTLTNDLYIILAGWEGNGETATFKAYINPLMNWLWIGGVALILSFIVTAWPTPQPFERPLAEKTGVEGVPVSS